MTLQSCMSLIAAQMVVPLLVPHGGVIRKTTSVQAFIINDNALGLQKCDPFALFLSVVVAIAQLRYVEWASEVTGFLGSIG